MSKERTTCQGRQHSDTMICGPCALQWDVNDPEPPECRKEGGPARSSGVPPYKGPGREHAVAEANRDTALRASPAAVKVEFRTEELEGLLLDKAYEEALRRTGHRPTVQYWELDIAVEGNTTSGYFAHRYDVIGAPGATISQAAKRCMVKSYFGPMLKAEVTF